MIQRIQTLYLILAVLVNIGFLFTPLFGHALADPAVWTCAALITAVTISSALSIWSIFQFANRKMQMVWVGRAMVMQTAALATALAILLTLGGIGVFLLEELLSLFILVSASGFQFLAHRSIKKDDDLVRSMDRIR